MDKQFDDLLSSLRRMLLDARSEDMIPEKWLLCEADFAILKAFTEPLLTQPDTAVNTHRTLFGIPIMVDPFQAETWLIWRYK